jgi:ADP-heptose:LPS heptosyltransferase
MFASILPDLIEDAKAVSYEVDARLTGLFKAAFPGVTVVPTGELQHFRDGFDVVLQAGSLGYTYRPTNLSFPAKPYLVADPARVQKWQADLVRANASRLKVGLSWRGGTQKTRRHARSLALEQLAPLIERDDCRFVSLQYGNAKDEIQRFNSAHEAHALLCPLEDFNNFDETAALIMALDLVISVQNTTIHLSGALGQTCWAMIPWHPEWRYCDSGETMPWYSSVRLYRQSAPDDWLGVVNAVSAALGGLVRKRRQARP